MLNQALAIRLLPGLFTREHRAERLDLKPQRLLSPKTVVSEIPILGNNIPSMGLTDSNLANSLFPKARQRVLALLFGSPDRSFYTNEVIKFAACGNGAVQRELARLEASGLIVSKQVGNQTHYQANRSSPIFAEIRNLVTKTFGVADLVRLALSGRSAQIEKAFIFGSVASGEDTSMSDLDLIVVSETLSYTDLYSPIESAEAQLGRKINPTIYTPSEFTRRKVEGNSFVQRVMDRPKIWLIGEENRD
jgi:predicted nucleotidyltransferase